MRDLRIAAICMKSLPGRLEHNLRRTEILAREAASRGAEIVCFPEANISGYGIGRDASRLAVPVPGDVSDEVVRIARELDVTILAGTLERDGPGAIFLTHLVAAPSGLLGAYRKVHLGPPERGLFTPGWRLPVFHWNGVSFGIALCYDVHFPELSTALCLKGSEILFFPHASPKGSPTQKSARWSRYLPARAVDNGVFVVACNQVGKCPGGLSFPGVAMVYDPRGRLVAKAVGWAERLIVADLKTAALQDVRSNRMAYFLPHRRPEVYSVKLDDETGR